MALSRRTAMVGCMANPKEDFARYCCELLASVGPCALKRMFGGYAISTDGLTLAWVVDTHTGEVILLSREYEPAEHDGLTLEDIDAAPRRFVPVPPGGAVAVDDMRAFAAQVPDARLKESLELALSAPRPERRFRAVLGWLPEELERWHSFRQGRVEQRAAAFLSGLGLAAARLT